MARRVASWAIEGRLSCNAITERSTSIPTTDARSRIRRDRKMPAREVVTVRLATTHSSALSSAPANA